MVVSDISPAVDDLLLSIFFYIVTICICNVIREILLFGTLLNSHMNKLIAAEVIGTVEAAVACFEINFIIYDVFGITVYIAAFYLTFLWQSFRPLAYQYDGNPLIVLVKHIVAIHPTQNHQYLDVDVDPLYGRIEFVMFMVAAQSFGAFIAYHGLVNVGWRNAHFWTFWKEEIYHMARYRNKSSWKSGISPTMEFAATVEGFFAMILYFWPFYIKFRGFRGDSAILLIDAGRAAVAGFGAPYTGGYFNPVLASALEMNTVGYSMQAKMFVYWVCPFAGTLVGMLLGGIKLS